jgi:hypothetical protein
LRSLVVATILPAIGLLGPARLILHRCAAELGADICDITAAIFRDAQLWYKDLVALVAAYTLLLLLQKMTTTCTPDLISTYRAKYIVRCIA